MNQELALTRLQTARVSTLNLPASNTGRNEFVLLISHPVGGINGICIIVVRMDKENCLGMHMPFISVGAQTDTFMNCGSLVSCLYFLPTPSP